MGLLYRIVEKGRKVKYSTSHKKLTSMPACTSVSVPTACLYPYLYSMPTVTYVHSRLYPIYPVILHRNYSFLFLV